MPYIVTHSPCPNTSLTPTLNCSLSFIPLQPNWPPAISQCPRSYIWESFLLPRMTSQYSPPSSLCSNVIYLLRLTLSPLFKIVAFLCPPSCPNPFYPALFFVLPKASLSSNILYNWIFTMFIIFLLHMTELSSTRVFFWFVHYYDPAPRIVSGLYMALHKYMLKELNEWTCYVCYFLVQWFSGICLSHYVFIELGKSRVDFVGFHYLKKCSLHFSSLKLWRQ